VVGLFWAVLLFLRLLPTGILPSSASPPARIDYNLVLTERGFASPVSESLGHHLNVWWTELLILLSLSPSVDHCLLQCPNGCSSIACASHRLGNRLGAIRVHCFSILSAHFFSLFPVPLGDRPAGRFAMIFLYVVLFRSRSRNRRRRLF